MVTEVTNGNFGTSSYQLPLLLLHHIKGALPWTECPQRPFPGRPFNFPARYAANRWVRLRYPGGSQGTARTLGPGAWDSNLASVTYQLCDTGHAASVQPLHPHANSWEWFMDQEHGHLRELAGNAEIQISPRLTASGLQFNKAPGDLWAFWSLRGRLSFLVCKDLPWLMRQLMTWPAALSPIISKGWALPHCVLIDVFSPKEPCGSCFCLVSVSAQKSPEQRGFPSLTTYLKQRFLVTLHPVLLSCFTFFIRYPHLWFYYTSVYLCLFAI